MFFFFVMFQFTTYGTWHLFFFIFPSFGFCSQSLFRSNTAVSHGMQFIFVHIDGFYLFIFVVDFFFLFFFRLFLYEHTLLSDLDESKDFYSSFKLSLSFQIRRIFKQLYELTVVTAIQGLIDAADEQLNKRENSEDLSKVSKIAFIHSSTVRRR